MHRDALGKRTALLEVHPRLSARCGTPCYVSISSRPPKYFPSGAASVTCTTGWEPTTYIANGSPHAYVSSFCPTV